jgi:hypothetical protein
VDDVIRALHKVVANYTAKGEPAPEFESKESE